MGMEVEEVGMEVRVWCDWPRGRRFQNQDPPTSSDLGLETNYF